MRLRTPALAVTGFALGAVAACWWEPMHFQVYPPAAHVAALRSEPRVAECVRKPRARPAADSQQPPAAAATPDAPAYQLVYQLDQQRLVEAESAGNALHVEEQHADLRHILGKERFERLAARWGELQAKKELWQEPAVDEADVAQVQLREELGNQLGNHDYLTLQPLQEWIARELGAEVVQKFTGYLRTLDARQPLEPLRAALLSANVPLDGAQIELLASAMHEAQAEFRAQVSAMWDPQQWAQGEGEDVSRAMARYDREAQLIERRLQRLRAAATGALSTAQQRALEQALRRQARAELLQLERRKLEVVGGHRSTQYRHDPVVLH